MVHTSLLVLTRTYVVLGSTPAAAVAVDGPASQRSRLGCQVLNLLEPPEAAAVARGPPHQQLEVRSSVPRRYNSRTRAGLAGLKMGGELELLIEVLTHPPDTIHFQAPTAHINANLSSPCLT
jgi:hypothetical protein